MEGAQQVPYTSLFQPPNLYDRSLAGAHSHPPHPLLLESVKPGGRGGAVT